MLNSLRENSKNLVMTIFFGIIIAVFVLQFGPGSGGGASCAGLTNTNRAAEVFGRSVSREELIEAQSMLGNPFSGKSKAMSQVALSIAYGLGGGTNPALDYVITREILANAATEMGFVVTEDQIDAEILQPTLPGRPSFINSKTDKFDFDQFRGYVTLSLRVSMKEYRQSLERYLLAQKMADFLFTQAKISDDEIKFQYTLDETRVELEFVKFFVAKYRDTATVSDDEAKTYADSHAAEVKKYYDDHVKDLYGEQIHARHILRKVDANTTDEDAKKEIDRLFKEVSKEGADFGQIAEENSQDPGSAVKGGDLGWSAPSGYVKEFREAAVTLNPGQISAPVKSDFGWHIIKLEDKKAAKTLDEVKIDIAKDLAKEGKAKELAKAEAEKYLATAKGLAADQGLEKLLPAPASQPASAPTSAPTSAPIPAPTSAPASSPTSTSAPSSEPTSTPTSAPVDPFALKVDTTSFNMTQAGFNNIPSLGTSKELAHIAFSLTKEKPVADQAFEVGDSYVIVRLKSHTDPDMEKFKTDSADLRERALSGKQGQFLIFWLQNERKKAQEAGEIKTYATKIKAQPEEQ